MSEIGRPSEFSQNIADLICMRLAEGESLRSICKEEELPSKATVMRWLRSWPEFRDQYAHAREIQADMLFDEVLEIADNSENDTYLDSDGNERTNHEVVARAKLRIDARKWMAGKLRPKVYGDKLDLEHSGAIDLKNMSDEDLERRIQQLMKEVGVVAVAEMQASLHEASEDEQ